MSVTKRELKKFIKGLEKIKGRHTELVSVYIPEGYNIVKVTQHLQEEQGTAKNIKDAKTRGNVIDSLEKCVRHLKLIGKTPENGLALFAGNVSAQVGKIDIQLFSVEPPEPLKVRIYRCDQTFMLDILRDQMSVKECYGLIVMDRREASIGFLRGKSIKMTAHLTSGVPGKFKAGGQCLVPDTLIQSSCGEILNIGKSHNPYFLKSADISTGTLVDSPITDKWAVRKPTYTITTKHPRLTVESSPDHVFFVASEEGIVEKKASELTISDSVIMPEKISVDGKRQFLPSKKYYNSFNLTKQGTQLIRKRRLEKNLFQKQLAKKVNVTQSTISSYEIGKIHAHRTTLKKLCLYLDINFENFVLHYCTPYKYSEITLPNQIDESFAQFLGYSAGDGCIGKDRITLFEQRKHVASVYKKKYDDYFNLESSYKFREKKNYHQLRFTSRPLVRLIKNEFPELQSALFSKIPKKILQSEPHIVAAFLKGIFDAEGWVSGSRLGIAMNNKLFIQQLLLLLLRFSIISSIHESDNRKNPYSNNPVYTLQIDEKESIGFFKEYIGFTAEDKQKKLETIFHKKSSKSNVRQILYSGQHIRSLVEGAGFNLQLFPKVSGFFTGKRRMSKSVFKSSILSCVFDKTLHRQLEKIYDTSLLPVQIQSITKSKIKKPLVDISVKNQNFIANGIIVHNSAQRFERLIDGMALEFYRRISEICNKEFLSVKDLKGLIVGGPGPTKEAFIEQLNNELRKRVIAVQDITYTDESGLHHLVDKSQDVLANEVILAEKKTMEKFLGLLGKHADMVSYGKAQVEEALEKGAVDLLLLSDSLDDNEIERMEEKAREYGTTVVVISLETKEGEQLKDIGGYGAILRYSLG